MNETQLVAVLAGFLTLGPACLMLRWVDPKTATWRISVPLSLFYVVLAVGWFWLFQWLEVPIIAYIDVIAYGLMACLAILNTVNRSLITSVERKRGQTENSDIVNS